MGAVTDLSAMRRSYDRGELVEATALPTWLDQFGAWFADAAAESSEVEANAVQIATVDDRGRPSVRTVLCKGFDERGVVFYTNYDSGKGADLAAHPYAAANFAWLSMERQVRLRGPVTKVSRAETEEYFATRPRDSQIGAWASPQSRVVGSREELEANVRELEERFAGQDVPPPPHWGGFRIDPDEVEFWQGRPNRMHDRLLYRRTDSGGWVLERLAP